MIELILQSYLTIFIAIGIASLGILVTGFYLIAKFARQEKQKAEASKDIAAIAGDDVVSTQLDLARAFIEIDQKPMAKKILLDVASQGSLNQREEAQRLLGYL